LKWKTKIADQPVTMGIGGETTGGESACSFHWS
jgi:hypothetical protein